MLQVLQRSPDPKTILIVLHQEQSTPGRIGRMLADLGYDLDIRRPRFGDTLPPTMAAHAGAIIFGGPMSANDGDAYIKQEINWIDIPLKEDKPFLGICLGAQMLAKCLNGKVAPHPKGEVEIGYYPVTATPAGETLCDTCFPDHVYHWHREGFEQPKGSVLLAQGRAFETQAVRVGRAAYGFQFHPEVTYAMMCRWTCLGKTLLTHPGAQQPQDHLQGWFQHDAKIARWTQDFLHQWLDNTEV